MRTDLRMGSGSRDDPIVPPLSNRVYSDPIDRNTFQLCRGVDLPKGTAVIQPQYPILKDETKKLCQNFQTVQIKEHLMFFRELRDTALQR